MTPGPTTASPSTAPLALSRCSKLALLTLGAGALLALPGLVRQPAAFGYSYLTAYLCLLSLCLGGLFLVMVHHLFDAGWSVALRRLAEHLGCLAPVLGLLFLPVAALAPQLYPWMQAAGPAAEPALAGRQPWLNRPVWLGLSALLFVVWGLLGWRLRRLSLQQDRTGEPACTRKLRATSALGMVAFAVTLTLGAVLWMQSLEPRWVSTIYGVYYFAGSMWVTVATVWALAAWLQRAGPLAGVVGPRQFHDLGVLWLAFTLFHAYIAFAQYFIIWNANLPEETFWYWQREQGSWFGLGLVLIFGHFLLPFLLLLRSDAKRHRAITLPLAAWAWLMHYGDIAFNVLPAARPAGFKVNPADLGCVLFLGGVMAWAWLRAFRSHPPFPLRDPRLHEALEPEPPEGVAAFATQQEGKP